MNQITDRKYQTIKSKLFLLIYLLLYLSSIDFAQIKSEKVVQTNNSIKISFHLTDKYLIKDGSSGASMVFPNALNEGKPGSPSLPSKIIYVAIPPKSKVSAYLSNQLYTTYSNMDVGINPAVESLNDSTLKYQNQNLKREYFITDQYPSSEYQVLGYTWIGDFYCAAIQINNATYNWKLKQVKLLLSANLNVNFSPVASYPTNTTTESVYDKALKKVIANYDYAKSFRSFRKLFSYPDTTGNWIDYSKQYVKLAVPADGIYRIGYQDLMNYGLNPANIDPSTIKIFCKGKELPLFVATSQAGTFSNGDYIEFWAQKNYGSPNYRQIVPAGTDYLNYMDRYTDTTFLWFTWGGQNGYRVNIDSSVSSQTTDTLNSYLNLQHFENDVRLWYYDSVVPRVQLPFWQENKVWTWNVLGTNSTISLSFQASNIIPNSPLKTYVRLISNAADIQTNAHKVGAGVNTNSIMDSVTFDFKQTANLFSTFSSNILNNGANTLNITDLPTSATFQQILLDWVDVEYYRNISAVNDSLYFKFPDSLSKKLKAIKITNITSPDSNLILYKVYPDTIKFENFFLNGALTKTLTFTDTVSGGDAYILVSKNYLMSPIFEEKKQFINLRANPKGADDIIISNKVLLKSATDYNNFIKSNYDVRTDLAFVDDIYDEFSFGYPKPEAIKNFLIYANENWTAPKPAYLTLIGDANYDYKNLWSPVPAVRKQNLVPSYGYPVSDVWYCVWDSNQADIPQMFIGRIPADNDQQVYFYLNKYKEYLAKPYDEWNKTFIFFSGGDPTIPGQIDLLKSENDYIFNSLAKPKPIGGEGFHFYKTITLQTNFGPYTQTQIQNAIDKGGLFISYIGHSGTQTWDNGITDVEALKNLYSDRFPLISDFGCSTGKFAEPDVSCFGELFINGSNDGQAITYLSNSSWGYVSTATAFPTFFYKQFLRDSITNVGEAHLLAKIQQFQQDGYSDVNRVFDYCNLLFGDPLVNLKLPTKPNLEISTADIQPSNNNPSDQDNLLPINIYYHNYGAVPNDSIIIAVKDSYNNNITYEQYFKVPIPLYLDSLTVNVPIKNLVGVHNLTVILDSANTIDEIYKNDNQASINFNVYSTSIRSLFNNQFYNSFNGTVSFLNPSYSADTASSSFLFQLDTTRNFTSPAQFEQRLGIFSSSIALPNLLPMKKYWWRTKIINSTTWSEANSFTNVKSNYKWYINNPVDSLSDFNYSNANYNVTDSSWELSSAKDELKISSAGSSDGELGSIQYNLNEMLPTTYYWGIATALIDTLTLKPYKVKYFLYPNPPAGDSLLSYLKSLPQGTVMAMAICDDGAQSVLGYTGGTPVRNEIKNWGSVYIDSVRYRESWCIIGKKGALPGTVPEVYKKQFTGIAIIDTSIIVKNDSGYVDFPVIKNASEWDSLYMNANIPAGSTLKLTPLGIKLNNSVDTLSTLSFANGYAPLNFINATTYQQLRVLANFTANQFKASPKIFSIAVKLKSLAELGTNYQVVSISNDSILVGSNENLQFYVYNVSDAPADSFNVMVEVVNADNSRNKIFESLVDSLNPNSRRLFNLNYSPTNIGAKNFYITIDPDNKILELYKDNNVFSIPFYVKSDTSTPSLKITFNGNDIMDGDYISNHPKIKIELTDPSNLPVTDTSAVSITLNGNPVSYANNSSSLSYQFNSANPKFVVNYTPTLTDGNYTLNVMGKNALGKSADSTGITRNFTVSSQFRILDVYNYPNPFKSGTYFTFKLPQLPDELDIFIYTVAGRLVKVIKEYSPELNYDFNKIYWDGRDEDGDLLANGVYFYKVVIKRAGSSDNVIQKLAIVR
ncbi:MAG: C25 family cysteine peptidase [Ignavibacteriaceae bacterium]